MTKIISFTKALNQTRGHALDGFFDDGDLLEFSQAKDAHTQAHDQVRPRPDHLKSIFASDWTNQELADLYRAYSLIQSAQPGLECDRGVSDEGDPWFLIGNDASDVLVHICRIKGTYILDSVGLSKILRGANFNALIEDFLTSVVRQDAQGAKSASSLDDTTNVIRLTRDGTVCLHPSMMIAALVWTLLMNAGELTLPPSNGDPHKSLDQDQDPGPAASTNDASPDGYDPAGFKVDLVKTEKLDAVADEFSIDLSTIEMSALKEDKHLHFSALSHALTTIAIAAGFYASAEVADAFWKSYTEMPEDTSDTLGEIDISDRSHLATPIDHLSDALALLSSVVDLVVFETPEDYAAENRNAGGESAATLTSAAMKVIEALKAGGGKQMLTTSSDLSKTIAEASQITETNTSGTEFIETEKALQAEMAASPFDKVSQPNPHEQASDAYSGASIQGVTQAYASYSANVSQYDALSLQSGLGKFNGELQKYFEVFDPASFVTEEGSTSASESGATFSESAFFRSFDDAARSFIDFRIASDDVEILIFDKEIIFVDKAAFSGNNTTVSWQLEDGGTVSMIGLSSDMAEFLVA